MTDFDVACYFLKNCSEIFTEEESKQLSYLMLLKTDCLNNHDNFSSEVTPLLDKILYYGLGVLINDEDIVYLQDEYGYMFDEAFDICNYCALFNQALVDSDCKHPTFLKYKHLYSSACYFADVIDNLGLLEEEGIEYLSDDVKEFFETNAILFKDDMFSGTVCQKEFSTCKELVDGMANNFTIVMTKLFNLDPEVAFGEVLVNKFNSSFIDLIIKIYKFKDYTSDSILKRFLDSITLDYECYYAGKASYKDDIEKEAVLLKKCNKM